MSDARLHVMFTPSAAVSLRDALARDGREDSVVCLFDDFSFGPIAPPDAKARARWVEEVLGYEPPDEGEDRVAEVVEASRDAALPPVLWVWRRHAASRAGALWWLWQLEGVPCEIVTVDRPNMLDTNGTGELLGCQIPLAREERVRLVEKWRQLQRDDAPFRVLVGDDLVSAPLDHFDPALLSFVRRDWQKAGLIVGKTLRKFHDDGASQTGDMVLAARLWDLAEAGALEWRGELGNLLRCELRLPHERSSD